MEDNEHGVKIFSEDNKNNNPCKVPQKSKIFRGPRRGANIAPCHGSILSTIPTISYQQYQQLGINNKNNSLASANVGRAQKLFRLSLIKTILLVFLLSRSIAENTMAGSINYLAPVDNASGKIFGKKQKFTAVTRNWGKRPRGCSATGQRDLKNKPYTEKELNHRAKFTAVAAATRSRMADPSQAATDMAAFKSQTKYKTLYHYVFRQEWNAYEG